jgi:hypothetical protein
VVAASKSSRAEDGRDRSTHDLARIDGIRATIESMDSSNSKSVLHVQSSPCSSVQDEISVRRWRASVLRGAHDSGNLARR